MKPRPSANDAKTKHMGMAERAPAIYERDRNVCAAAEKLARIGEERANAVPEGLSKGRRLARILRHRWRDIENADEKHTGETLEF